MLIWHPRFWLQTCIQQKKNNTVFQQQILSFHEPWFDLWHLYIHYTNTHFRRVITLCYTCNNSDPSMKMNQIDDVSDYWSLLSSMDRHNGNQTSVGQWYRFHGFRRPFWLTSSDPQGFVWTHWKPEKYGNKRDFSVSKLPVEGRSYGVCWHNDAQVGVTFNIRDQYLKGLTSVSSEED